MEMVLGNSEAYFCSVVSAAIKLPTSSASFNLPWNQTLLFMLNLERKVLDFLIKVYLLYPNFSFLYYFWSNGKIGFIGRAVLRFGL